MQHAAKQNCDGALGGTGWPALGPTRVQRTRGDLADEPGAITLFRLRRPGRLETANRGHPAEW